MIYGLYTAAGLLAALCIYFLLRRRPHALFVLAYEKAGAAPKHSSLKGEWISPQVFGRHLNWLSKHGFTVISLQTLSSARRLPAKPVVLVFLGGYQSFFTQIFPMLKQANTPVAVFLPPALAGAYNAWQDPHREPWQNLLTENQIKEMQKSGLIDFGALCENGEDLTLLPLQQAAGLLQESAAVMQIRLKLKPKGFAFWPAARFTLKKASRLLPEGFGGLVLTPLEGPNKRTGKKLFLKVLFPARRPLAVRWALWKRR